MLKFVILSILLFALTVTGQQHLSTSVQTCNNNSPLPVNVYIVGCIEPPCGLPQLQDAVINIVFKAPRLMRNISSRAFAYLPGVFLPLPYPLGDQTNACRGLTNSRCPVVEGEVLQYTLNMAIESFMPVGTHVNLEFSLVDDESRSNIFCVRVPIRVDPPIDNYI